MPIVDQQLLTTMCRFGGSDRPDEDRLAMVRLISVRRGISHSRASVTARLVDLGMCKCPEMTGLDSMTDWSHPADSDPRHIDHGLSDETAQLALLEPTSAVT